MADDRLDGLIDSLEVTLDAAIARQEEEAAEDLAMSLRQGRSLQDVLARGGWRALLDPGLEESIEAVGQDFVDTGRSLIPLMRLRARSAPEAPRPELSEATLIERLRALARSRRTLSFATASGMTEGSVRWVGTDHVAVAGRDGVALVPLAAVDLVRLTGGPP